MQRSSRSMTGRRPVREMQVPAKTAEKTSFDTSFETLPAFQQMVMQRTIGDQLGLVNPYYRVHDARGGATSSLDGRAIVNFASYDYLGLNGDPRITQAVQEAAASWGTSVSASRITAGEREAHRELEAELARLYNAEDAVAFVSGHATAVSTIAALLDQNDLILHDSLIHNCVVAGALMSGAARRSFAHNDIDALEVVLREERKRYNRVLIATEGLFSMDGDGPDLARLVELKQRYGCWLLVDDAHGLGVLGQTGRGIFEHADVDPCDVDIWLGTLSKSLVSCGGYVAGSKALVDLLKCVAPGFVYSVGMPVPAAVAATMALRIMLAEPERVQRLQRNGTRLRDQAKVRGLNTGDSWGYAVTPIIVGDTLRTVMLAQRLLARGINAFPVLPPGVPEATARLRFFVSSEHTFEQIDAAIAATREEIERLEAEDYGMNALPRLLAAGPLSPAR
ncbi:MAG: aminotransferase class I/II-fold pyridoxal phosphate-dependent enzyme [Burkholderiales bacterium]|nr:MAG: aminotransferase class I/II-fold pyridoxal phosphate-dependent enzyme [Burkholderiales bacterium]